MDKNEVDGSSQSHLLQQIIAETLLKELKKKDVPEEVVLTMLLEHKSVAELLGEVFIKQPSRQD